MHDAPTVRPQVTFVVPCFNEAANIAATIAEIEGAAGAVPLTNYEILIVDDCSTDDTVAVVTEIARGKPQLILIRNPKNLGFGGAYKTGVKAARGTYVIMVPGDNAHPREGIIPILACAGNADIVIPYVANPEARALHRRIISITFTCLVNWVCGLKVPYFNGLVLHKTDLLRSVEIQTNSFAYQAEALVKLIHQGASYVTVAVFIHEHQNGRTTAFGLKNICRVAQMILRLRRAIAAKC